MPMKGELDEFKRLDRDNKWHEGTKKTIKSKDLKDVPKCKLATFRYIHKFFFIGKDITFAGL